MKGQTGDPNTLRAQYLENSSWRCYLATIANYQIACCEAVRSAILATAWLLVTHAYKHSSLSHRQWRSVTAAALIPSHQRLNIEERRTWRAETRIIALGKYS